MTAPAVDASHSPAAVAGTGTTATTASFTPQAGQRVVALWCIDDAGKATTMVLSGSGGDACVMRRIVVNTDLQAEFWVSDPLPTTIARTLTATTTGSTLYWLYARSWSNVLVANPVGAFDMGSVVVNPWNWAAYTSTADNSIGLAGGMDDTAPSAIASTDTIVTQISGGESFFYVVKAAATPTAPTAVIFNIDPTGTGATSLRAVFIELLGTLTLSAPSTPAAPTVNGDHHAVHAQVVPPANGNDPITGYTWETAPGPGYSSWTTFGSPTALPEVWVTGLTVGTSYKVRVTATNGTGSSSASSASAAATPVNLTGYLGLEDGTSFLALENGNALSTEV